MGSVLTKKMVITLICTIAITIHAQPLTLTYQKQSILSSKSSQSHLEGQKLYISPSNNSTGLKQHENAVQHHDFPVSMTPEMIIQRYGADANY